MSVDTENELDVVYARDLDREKPQERWLIEGLWGRRAAGVLGGAPKCFKSFLGLDLAVSVASATRALGRFAVQAPGRSLIYLAEDEAAQVRLRVESLCRHRGLDLEELDLVAITEPVLRLDNRADQERLRNTLCRYRPRLLLLDPLVRLHGLDENHSQAIAGLLSYFRDLVRSFDLALVLVHHTSKKSRSRPGQALRGSSDLHAFGDSNAYLSRKGEQVVLTLEHRAARPPDPMTLELVTCAEKSDTHLEIIDESASAEERRPTLEERVLDLLDVESPMSRSEIRSRLRVNNQRLGETLCALEKNGRIHRGSYGWAMNTP